MSGSRRAGLDAVLLRRLPHDSQMQRLTVATKLVALAALTVATGLDTGWAQFGGVAAVVAAAALAARLPLRALPRLPSWFLAVMLAGLALATLGGAPERYLRLVGFSLLFGALSLLIAWTSDLGEIAPTLARAGAPLRRVGLPLDEWALTAALCVRCLPLIVEEIRTVIAAHRQRPTGHDPGRIAQSVVDVVTASMAASIRRAGDLGEVIAMRGGVGAPSRTPLRPQVRDAVALLLVAAASVLPGLLA